MVVFHVLIMPMIFLKLLGRSSRSLIRLRLLIFCIVFVMLTIMIALVSETILQIIQIATRLREGNISLSNHFVVYQVLDSLSMELEQLKVSYTVLRDKWSIKKMIFWLCSGGRLNRKRAEKAYLTMVHHSRIIKVKVLRFRQGAIKAITKTHPALTMFRIRLLRDRGLVSSIRRGVISRLILTSSKQWWTIRINW